MLAIHNVHTRWLPVAAGIAGEMLNTLSSSDDQMWPVGLWPRMRLDRPLGVGARGGHGPIRYRVTDFRPGSRVRFDFTQPQLLVGYHQMEVASERGGTLLRHVIRARPSGFGWLLWPLAVRWLHDALIEDAFDGVERRLTGSVQRPQRWSLWVRWWRWMLGG